MSIRGLSVLALASVLGAFGLVFAFAPRPAPAAQARPLPAPPTLVAAPIPSAPPPTPDARFAALPALLIVNQATRERLELKLYDSFGAVDERAAAALDELLCDARKPAQRETTRIDRRTLQLLFKAAYHFRASELEIVSAYRKPGRRHEGPHGVGSAIDFRLRGVTAKELASYLRELPRTGVGVYTHPKTQYVHLDNRENSFHWLDASPPRRRWREKSLGGRGLVARDAQYAPASDLPF
jgi:uncharacterized protein YcbK (DUF882 family)